MTENDIDSSRHRLRLRRRLLVPMDDAAQLDPAQSDPYHASRLRTPYQADVWFDEDGLNINKAATTTMTISSTRVNPFR